MNVAAMIVEARSLINQTDSSNSPITDTQLTAWANQGYRRLLTRLQVIPITQTDYTLAATVALNANTLSIDNVRILFSDGTTSKWIPLEILSLKELIERHPDYENDDADQPMYFVRTGTFTARIHPKPDSNNDGNASSVRTNGMQFPSDLISSDTPDLPVNLQEALLHWMAYRAQRQSQEHQAAQEQLLIFNAAIKEMKLISTKFSKQRTRFRFADTE